MNITRTTRKIACVALTGALSLVTLSCSMDVAPEPYNGLQGEPGMSLVVSDPSLAYIDIAGDEIVPPDMREKMEKYLRNTANNKYPDATVDIYGNAYVNDEGDMIPRENYFVNGGKLATPVGDLCPVKQAPLGDLCLKYEGEPSLYPAWKIFDYQIRTEQFEPAQWTAGRNADLTYDIETCRLTIRPKNIASSKNDELSTTITAKGKHCKEK